LVTIAGDSQATFFPAWPGMAGVGEVMFRITTQKRNREYLRIKPGKKYATAKCNLFYYKVIQRLPPMGMQARQRPSPF
jgi:hypothetical protein